MIDHALSYALTATADVPVMYIQQFWKTLPVETPDHLFIEPADLKFIQRFLKIVGYEGIVDKWDFIHYVQQKKDMIQYPRFAKLIIADLMKKERDCKGMLIPNEFLTNDICATIEYKEYEKVFGRVDIPTIQPQPVESTQGINRTPSATGTPTPITIEMKKRKQVAGESSTPRKSLKVTIKQKKSSTTPIPPPSDDRERDEIAEATLFSLTMHKTTIAAEAQENVAKDKEDTETRIEPGSHKEHPKTIEDDDGDIEKEKKDDEKDDDVDNNVDKEK
ncbi:hypothetical protein Tco_0758226, partial [Tanacetum coccineum]